VKLLDLYSGAGGAAMGYHLAGFTDITGVDMVDQPRYPFNFIQADALEYLHIAIDTGEIEEYDLIHASPPCKLDNVMSRGRWKEKRLKHADLIEPTIELLKETGKPYVVENVSGARHKFASHLMLCGTMFGLQTVQGNQLWRHRYFEIYPHILVLQPPCNHNTGSPIGVHGGGQHPNRRIRPVGVYGSTGGSSDRDDKSFFGIEARREVMEISWMTNKELTQAIPPAYTRFISEQLIKHLERT
jgi:DNA (cytosine-5)-methyltransferase 1